ncbi:asparagine synthase-related protein [Vulgatibacter sp.]|uniref:asparagine synthase-related protein n=1 Tax=Vulgatibacter sp. TaxID=1971226 RepID=UPI0035690F61
MNNAPNLEAKRQIVLSPYADRTSIDCPQQAAAKEPIDKISIADLLRYAFVCPPHSIFLRTKVASLGFSVYDDLFDRPSFRFEFEPPATPRPSKCRADPVAEYHRLLCAAVTESSRDISAPWMLQSGGKDSTSLAIAIAEARPETTCLTYLGGREEDEVESARAVARKLGLRHESLVCDPERAYERYLALVPALPLLTGDFATLSYADLLHELSSQGGDGVFDGLGSDVYFGTPVSRQQRMLSAIARGFRLPAALSRAPLMRSSFALSYAMNSLQMFPLERFFPGSRFADSEVDLLFGSPIAERSRARLSIVEEAWSGAESIEARRAIAVALVEAGAGFAKGIYTASALGIRSAYPYCNRNLIDWVHRELPDDLRMDADSGTNKVVVRQHIARHFHSLPYVEGKGSFRFDVRGLAARRFDQVHALACELSDFLPGARSWLEANRRYLGNKLHASKFYLLAVTLPWLAWHGRSGRGAA